MEATLELAHCYGLGGNREYVDTCYAPIPRPDLDIWAVLARWKELVVAHVEKTGQL